MVETVFLGPAGGRSCESFAAARPRRSRPRTAALPLAAHDPFAADRYRHAEAVAVACSPGRRPGRSPAVAGVSGGDTQAIESEFAARPRPASSNAAATRRARSPPAAKEGRDSEQQDEGAAARTDRAPAAAAPAARLERTRPAAAPARYGRHSARERILAGRRHLVGDRGRRPMGDAEVASRRRTGRGWSGKRTNRERTVAARRDHGEDEKADRHAPSAAATSHSPSQETARKNPTAVTIDASAGPQPLPQERPPRTAKRLPERNCRGGRPARRRSWRLRTGSVNQVSVADFAMR